MRTVPPDPLPSPQPEPVSAVGGDTNGAAAAHDDHFENLVNVAPDAMYLLQDDVVVFVNPAAVQQLRAPSATALIGI
ncbi:MAG: hypothetical protein M3N23_06420, partial [Pseudomonadota bacterium]|nr:hypothetical protein [Pseudomonadota bacterium]